MLSQLIQIMHSYVKLTLQYSTQNNMQVRPLKVKQENTHGALHQVFWLFFLGCEFKCYILRANNSHIQISAVLLQV